MKKFMTAVMAATMIGTIGVVTSLAATPADRPYFIDANGDGICDNRGSRQCGAFFTDANGDGICDNRGSMSHGQRCGMNSGARRGCCR